MTAALPSSCVERFDAGASTPGRVPSAAPQSGPSFADLLQRGQAAHGAPSRADAPQRSPADSPPRHADESAHDDADDAAASPDAAGRAARTAAKPAPRAREKAAGCTPPAKAPPATARAADNADEASPPRRAADDAAGSGLPGAEQLAGLQEWMASLVPPEPLPAQPGAVAAQALADAAGGVDALASTDGANTALPADRAVPLRPADGAALPPPAPGAGEPVLAAGAALPGPAEDATALVPAHGAEVTGSTQASALLRPAEGATLPRPADGGVALDSMDGATLRSAAGDAILPRPAPGATNALPARRGAADGDEPWRDDGHDADAARIVRPAAAHPEPAALAPGERRAAPPELPAVRDLVQGLLGGAAGAVPRGLDAATPAPITLPASLHSPEFARLLGAQVSVLARDGVQRAELHLNPAEMGPISVHIRIDDANARVDFHAAAAATREAIERGLPELASALREQGLTLAGGGVFQHLPDPRGGAQRDPAEAAGQARRNAPAAGDAPARTIATARKQGMLDVYA